MQMTPEDWKVVQDAVNDDCAMGIVADLAHGHCTWEQATDRICAYAQAAFDRGQAARPEEQPREWMAKNVDTFASFYLQRYEKTGSLRESLMFAYVKTFDGEDPCQRCYNCGSMNRVNGQLVHQADCFVGRSRPQREQS